MIEDKHNFTAIGRPIDGPKHVVHIEWLDGGFLVSVSSGHPNYGHARKVFANSEQLLDFMRNWVGVGHE